MDRSGVWSKDRVVGALLAASAALVLTLTGCGSSGQPAGRDVSTSAADSQATDGTSTDSGSSTNGDQVPPPDNGGGGGGPSLELASLPVGGSSTDLQDANHQCADVNYAGSGAADLSAGIAVVYTGATPSSSTFVVVGGSCGDSVPPCAGYVFTTTQRECVVGVEARDVGPDDIGPKVTLAVSGHLACTADASRCASFLTAANGPSTTTVDLNTPETTDSTSTDEGSSSTGDTADPAGSDSSDGSGLSSGDTGVSSSS